MNGARNKRIFLLAFACILLAALVACAPSDEALRINEVVSDNEGSYIDPVLGAADWIELYNGGARPIRLTGYILTDKADTFDPLCVLPDITVDAGGHIVLFTGSKTPHPDVFSLPFGISRAGDTLYLLNTAGKLVDKFVVPSLYADVSYARREDGSAGYCYTPTPCAPNGGEILDAPKTEVTAEQSDVPLLIAEVFTNGADGAADWVELYNPTDAEIPLTDCYLSDDPANPKKHRLPFASVPANGYLPLTDLGVGLSSAGETVLLYDAYARLIDRTEVPALPEGYSWARNADGTFGYCAVPSLGAPNDASIGSEPTRPMDASDPVRISEALFDNTRGAIDTYGDRSDWVELHNAGDAPVSLLGYYLSDDADCPMRFALPDITLAPNEYRIVFLSGKAAQNGELHADFSVSAGDSGCYLFHAETRGMDAVLRADGLFPDVSQGIDADGTPIYYAYPTPGYENAKPFPSADAVSAYPIGSVHISEVSASEEWVELRNGASEPIDLTGWQLTDGRTNPKPLAVDGTIAGGGYTLLSAEGAFGIAASGETLYLTDATGNLRDAFDTGALIGGQTSGRSADAPTVSRVFFQKPTPGAANAAAYTVGRASAPQFSDRTLYRDAPFLLTLSVPDPNATIRYTTDGSKPTEASAVYTAPIPIDRSTVVCAAAFSDGYEPSMAETAHYLFETPHTLPVVAIACDGADWAMILRAKLGSVPPDCEAALTFHEADGTPGASFPAAIRARGNTSLKYDQKSLSIHLRAPLGQRTVYYPFWGEGTAAPYATFALRNGSQDIASARLRDSFANRAVDGLHLDHIQTRPVIVYVNGAYFGIMDWNEGLNQDYLEAHYGIDPDTVNIVGKNAIARHGSVSDYGRVRRFARGSNFADDAVVAEFSQWVDVAYVTDYLIAQTFFGNYDIHNQNYWATDDYAVRWRPYLYDVDRCLCENRTTTNLFSAYFSADGVQYNPMGDRVNMDIFCALRRNRAWCDAFLDRYAELLCTSFSVERLTALLDEMAGALRPEMPRHIATWGMPRTVSDWETAVAAMRAEIPRRHEAIQTLIIAQFRITEADWRARMEKYAAG